MSPLMVIPPRGFRKTLAVYWRILLPAFVVVVVAIVGVVGWILGWWR
jgi:hypothetical protein